MRQFFAACGAVCLALLVSACGGGGGGGGSDGGSAALSFSPSVVTANIESGTSATLTVRATAADPSIFNGTLYVFIVDREGVLAGNVELAQVSATTFSATLHTSPTLPAGRQQGNFLIQLCRDQGCASQYAAPVPLPYDLTIAPGPLKATASASTTTSAHWGGAAPADVTFTVTGPAAGWTATTNASWLRITGGSSSTGGGSFRVSYALTGLAVGNYADTVTVRSTDGQTVAVPFQLTLLPTQFVINGGVPTFTAVNGTDIAPQTMNFSLDSGASSAWTASTTAAWLGLTPASGSATPAAVTLSPDSIRANLASGAYTADVVLASTGINTKTVPAQLTLLAPTLALSAPTVTLGGPKGRDLTGTQSVTLTLNTATRSWPWAFSAPLPAWLSSSAASGNVNPAGVPLTLSINTAAVTAGTSAASLHLQANVNADAVGADLQVNVNADQRRLLASEWGVAFASTPVGTVVTRSVQISDNFGGALAWSAASDSAWLAVTTSGNTGGSPTLNLTADPATLPAGALSTAMVTISTSAAGVAPAVIRVALWKDASSTTAITTLPLDYNNIVADTIRPYIYANKGGADIDIYNAYTAQKVATIAGAGAALGQMSVSPDGQRLYALDTAGRSMAVVDLATRTTTTWALDNAVGASTTVLAIRPNGVEVVLVGDGTAYTAGRSLGATRMYDVRAATPDGRYAFSLGARYSVDYSAMSGGVLFATMLNGLDSNSGGNLRDVAANKQGTRTYEASGGGVSSGGYRCAITDAVTGSYIGALPGGDAYPNNVEVTNDGRPICGIFGWYTTYDIWVHASNGTLLQGYKIAGYARAMKDGQMVVTPDGFVVAALTDDPRLAFVPIGP